MSFNYTPKSSIVVPLKNTMEDEIIEIDFDSLPEGEEVLQILKGERAALHYWLDLALEYYKAGSADDFVKILQQSGGDAGLEYEDNEKDQMRALDLLAAYYVLQGNKERNESKRKEWFTKATLLYTTADKIIMYDQNHLLGRAYFCLLEGSKMDPGTSANPNQARKAKMDQARAQFDFVINEKPPIETPHYFPKVIPALMGKACLAFDDSRYKDALSYYKKCLRINPNCPADVRVGMGYCLARLGKVEKARIAFERALEIDPSNIPSIVALAILELNTLEPEGIRSAIQAFSTAYQREPENPIVLNHLANHFFCRNDLEKTENLAFHAITIAENDAMKAESFYHLARCYHKKGNFTDASRFYYQSTTLAHPKFILPYCGLGQMYISQGEYEKAINVFEKVIKVAPNNYETLCALGSLYANIRPTDSRQAIEALEKAREYLRKCVELVSDDVDVLIELAQLQEKQDPQASLKLYLLVAEILNNDGVQPQPEILNNAGSLYFTLNQLEESKSMFQQARSVMLSSGIENLNDESAALLITITYNLGRVNEQLCLFDEAEKLYRQIIRQRPSYIDCIIRLGCLIRDKGDTHNASLLFKESMVGSLINADPWALIGNMHMAKSEWGPAQKKFEQILKMPNCQNDTYSMIALGNIWLELLFSSRTKEKDEVNRQRALSMYTKALKMRPQNIWAANGIGCILAQKGAIFDARDIFSQVREATADFPDVWINIAHIYMEQKQYVSALQMYRNCMAKFNRFNDVQLLLYIARAYWKADKMLECRDSIEKALIESPENIILRFNHAVILQRMATNVLQEEKSTSSEVLGAVEDLKIAEKTFLYISTMSPEDIARYKYVSRTVCGSEAGSCSDLLKQAMTYLQRAQAKDEEERRQREYQEEQRRILLAQQIEQERLKQEERLMELEKLKQLRQEYVDKTREILRIPQLKDEKKPRVVSRKQRREEAPDFVNDGSDLGEYEYENDDRTHSNRTEQKKRRPNRDAEPSGSSDEEDDYTSKRRAERMEDELLPARLRTKVKSKAFVSSSSSSPSVESSPSQSRANSPAPSDVERAAALSEDDGPDGNEEALGPVDDTNDETMVPADDEAAPSGDDEPGEPDVNEDDIVPEGDETAQSGDNGAEISSPTNEQ